MGGAITGGGVRGKYSNSGEEEGARERARSCSLNLLKGSGVFQSLGSSSLTGVGGPCGPGVSRLKKEREGCAGERESYGVVSNALALLTRTEIYR